MHGRHSAPVNSSSNPAPESVDRYEVPRIARDRAAFLHIEKTAGTALTKFLASFFNKEECCPQRFPVMNRCLPAYLEQFRFFSAHSNMQDFAFLPQPCRYITVLRNPIDRALSYYEFLRYHTDGFEHMEPNIRVAKSLDVNEFFFKAPTATLKKFSNYMTACLSSDHLPVDASNLATAKANLCGFAAVGVTEHLGLLLRRIAEQFDINTPDHLDRMNITRDKLSVEDPRGMPAVAPASLQRLRELNELDFDLYDFVIETFVRPTGASRVLRLGSLPDLPRMRSLPDCIAVPLSYEGKITNGPHVRVLPGNWNVAIELAAECGQVPSQDYVASIDAWSASQRVVFARMPIRGSDFDWPRFTAFNLNVATASMVPDMEFRISKDAGVRLICRGELTLSAAAPVPVSASVADAAYSCSNKIPVIGEVMTPRIAWEPPIKQPWYSTPFFESILHDSSFSNAETDQLRQYAEQGYLIFDPELDDVDDIARELREQLPYPIKQGKPFNRVQDHWRHNEYVRKLACNRNVLDKLELIYQRPVIPFQTLNFPVGTEQAAHSDTIHFNSIPERWMCGVWVALEDIDSDNGPLFYYPGSHKLPILNMHDLGLSPQDYSNLGESYPIYERVVGEMLRASGLKRVELSLKKGQALIWEANLFHGGSEIRDPNRTRLSQVTHYYFEGCSYYGPLQSDLPLGKMVWRHVEDIISGSRTRHSYNGRPAIAPMFDGTPRMLKLADPPPSQAGCLLAVGETVEFSSQQRVTAHCLAGWSDAEPLGVWSIAATADLAFETEEPVALVELKLSAFIGQPDRVQQLEFSLAGDAEAELNLQSEMFEDEADHLVTVVVPFRSGRFDLRLRLVDPISPASLAISADTRMLGVRLSAMRVLTFGAALAPRRN